MSRNLRALALVFLAAGVVITPQAMGAQFDSWLSTAEADNLKQCVKSSPAGAPRWSRSCTTGTGPVQGSSLASCSAPVMHFPWRMGLSAEKQTPRYRCSCLFFLPSPGRLCCFLDKAEYLPQQVEIILYISLFCWRSDSSRQLRKLWPLALTAGHEIRAIDLHNYPQLVATGAGFPRLGKWSVHSPQTCRV